MGVIGLIDKNRDEARSRAHLQGSAGGPSTCCAAKSRPLSERARRDAFLIPIPVGLWSAHFRVYGVRKLWKAAPGWP